MAIETVVAEQWLYATLSGDATLRGYLTDGVNGVHMDMIRQGGGFPAVLIGNLSGEDLDAIGGGATRIWTDMLYVVRGVAAGSSYAGTLASISQRIDALLHYKSGTATDGTVWACRRERPFRMAEVGPGGEQYRHLGSIYRILAVET